MTPWRVVRPRRQVRGEVRAWWGERRETAGSDFGALALPYRPNEILSADNPLPMRNLLSSETRNLNRVKLIDWIRSINTIEISIILKWELSLVSWTWNYGKESRGKEERVSRQATHYRHDKYIINVRSVWWISVFVRRSCKRSEEPISCRFRVAIHVANRDDVLAARGAHVRSEVRARRQGKKRRKQNWRARRASSSIRNYLVIYCLHDSMRNLLREARNLSQTIEVSIVSRITNSLRNGEEGRVSRQALPL